jgi:Fur family ferric uptake transcriptional regulator
MSEFNQILDQLREQGLKITKYKVALIELFLALKKPLAVSDILDELAKKSMHPNKTTIYREIDSLESQGHIKSIDFGDEKKRYELSSQDHHHHLICQNCNFVEDIVLEDDLTEIEKKVKKSSNFKIESHSLEFFGRCSNCQT